MHAVVKSFVPNLLPFPQKAQYFSAALIAYAGADSWIDEDSCAIH
jgi:hypothetical protein